MGCGTDGHRQVGRTDLLSPRRPWGDQSPWQTVPPRPSLPPLAPHSRCLSLLGMTVLKQRAPPPACPRPCSILPEHAGVSPNMPISSGTSPLHRAPGSRSPRTGPQDSLQGRGSLCPARRPINPAPRLLWGHSVLGGRSGGNAQMDRTAWMERPSCLQVPRSLSRGACQFPRPVGDQEMSGHHFQELRKGLPPTPGRCPA